jgi:hypothetical protein
MPSYYGSAKARRFSVACGSPKCVYTVADISMALVWVPVGLWH